MPNPEVEMQACNDLCMLLRAEEVLSLPGIQCLVRNDSKSVKHIINLTIIMWLIKD